MSIVVKKEPAPPPIIIKTVQQGPPGPPGPPGTPGSGEPGDYLQTALRLGEFDTDEKRAAALANQGIAVIDGGTFN